MREIKFRAWDMISKRYFNLNDELSSIPFYELFCHTPDSRALEIEQFTGLKDKNGVEIYEGDIVTTPWHWEEPHVIVIPDDYYSFMEYSIYDQMTIIGNIHQNPELLK